MPTANSHGVSLREKKNAPQGIHHEGRITLLPSFPDMAPGSIRDGRGTHLAAGCPDSHRAISLVFVCIAEYREN